MTQESYNRELPLWADTALWINACKASLKLKHDYQLLCKIDFSCHTTFRYLPYASEVL